LMNARYIRRLPESPMIAIPLVRMRRALAMRIHSTASEKSCRFAAAMRGGPFGHLLMLVPALTTAVNGWLTVGLLAQSVLIAGTLLRRLTSQMSTKRLTIPSFYCREFFGVFGYRPMKVNMTKEKGT
jgi:hypothetical protein